MICDQQLTYHNNTSSMLGHLRSKHSQVANGHTSGGGETSGVHGQSIHIKCSGPTQLEASSNITYLTEGKALIRIHQFSLW